MYFAEELLNLGTVQKLRTEISLIWVMNLVGQFMVHNHSVLGALWYFRYPGHRRYTYNVILGTVEYRSWLTYPLTLVTCGRMLQRWGSISFYIFLQTTYFEVASFWMNRLKSVRI